VLGKSEVGWDVASSQLCVKFIEGPGLVRKPAGEVSVKPVLRSRGMGGFVKSSNDPNDRLVNHEVIFRRIYRQNQKRKIST
jgi:hypothetical protein